MRLVIDTGVLFHPAALRAIAKYNEDIVLPAIAYAERVRQLRAQGRSVDEFASWLEANGIGVEAFGRTQARRIGIVEKVAWGRIAREAFIATPVETGDLLWTTNPRDFRAVGVAEEQIVPVPAPV